MTEKSLKLQVKIAQLLSFPPSNISQRVVVDLSARNSLLSSNIRMEYGPMAQPCT
jgi:hypothetical protein